MKSRPASGFFKHIEDVRRAGECAWPPAGGDGHRGCIPINVIRHIVRAYNLSHAGNPLPDDGIGMYREIRRRFDSETRFLRHSGLETSKFLKPQPFDDWDDFRRPGHWLTSTDIRRVLERYESIFKDRYRFLGVLSRDFGNRSFDDGSCMGTKQLETKHSSAGVDMCDIRLSELRDKPYFGFVMNTDHSMGTGEHWVSVFVGLDKALSNYGVFFYDSNGVKDRRRVPMNVRRFADELVRQMGDGDAFRFRWNVREHQKRDGECGMFAISFQVAMLMGTDFDEYVASLEITDRLMTQLRQVFYSSDTSNMQHTENAVNTTR